MPRRAVMAAPLLALAAAGLSGCASGALQIASLALDGAAYMATGKGTADLALSAAAAGDCRLANAVQGRDICVREAEADALATAAEAVRELTPAAGPSPASAFASFPVRRTAREAEPQATELRVTFRESPGMNIAEVTGAPPDGALTSRLDAAGTLHVFLVPPEGDAAAAALFTVPGYAHNRGAFTGVLLGTRFLSPDSFAR